MRTTACPTVWILCTTLATTAGVDAQDVLLSEVVANPQERWIEIHNRGSQPADLSAWSLYHASLTPHLPQNYWWAFPSGTTIAAGGFLRVHWFAESPPTPVPGELWTGTSVFAFLFGLGGEALRPERGALALLRSQESTAMASASVVVDWVSWGDNGFRREALAVQAGRWTAGRHVSAIQGQESIARNIVLVGRATSTDQEWFHDPTPTPNGENVPGLAIATFGQPCLALGHHLLGEPRLQTLSSPVVGNRSFGLRVTNTTGLLGETVLLGFTFGAAPGGGISLLPPVPGGSTCPVLIDPYLPLGSLWLRARTGETDAIIPIVPPELQGMRFFAQGLVLDWFTNAYPPYQGTTDAVDITIGG